MPALLRHGDGARARERSAVPVRRQVRVLMHHLALGSTAWHAEYRQSQVSATCGDCAGKCVLVVIMGDESRVSIECPSCRGRGLVTVHEFAAKAVECKITSVEIDGDEVIYNHYVGRHFATEAEALVKADEVRAEAEAKDKMRNVALKHDHAKTWAWNATYHRKCLKEAQDKIKYHSECLAYATVKAQVQA